RLNSRLSSMCASYTSTVIAGVWTACENCQEPSKSTLTTQQIEMWMPTATEARKVIVSAGKASWPDKGFGGDGSGSIETPIAAVNDSDADASPPSTSTEAWPFRMIITVMAEPFTSSEKARGMDADPSAMPTSIDRPRPIPAWISRSGAPFLTPVAIAPLPASGEIHRLNGCPGAALPEANAA